MTSNPCVPDLYALHASKNRLCMLCEDTTPKKTAYNAYRNANRRVRRAESTKMYAVRDAYKVHTSAYKCIKKSKKRKIPLSTSLYCLFLYLLLFASSGIPQQTVNDFFTACFRRRWAFRAFIARLTGCPPSSRPFLPYGHRAFLRANTHFVRPIGFVAWVDDRKVVCIVCIKNATMRSMREHNSGIDCIQCIQKRE